MKRKKSILGTVVWFLFTIFVVCTIGQTLYTMTTIIPESSWIMEGLVLGCIIVAAVCALMVLRMIAVHVQKKFVMTAKKSIVLDIITIILLLCVTILSRLYYLNTIDMNQAENLYFQIASVGTDKLVFDTTNHAAILYVYILSFLLALLGNKISICIYFQLLLQCITLLFTFLAVRNISGKMTAFTAALVLAVSTSYKSFMLPLAPENLLICIFMLGFWMSSLLWKYMNVKQTTKVFDTILFFMAGLSTSAIIYTDVTGFILFVMSVAGIFISNKNTAKAIKHPILQAGCYILGSIVGMAALFEIEAVTCKESFLHIIDRYINSTITVTIHTVSVFPSVILEISIIMILIAGIWCVRYWQADYDENVMYILMLIGAVCINICFQTSIHYHVFLMFAWIIMLSASLKSLCSKYGKKSENETGIILLSNLTKEEPASRIGDKSEMNDGKNDKKQNEVQEKPNLIPNPLPLPRQHERKEMDYAFVPDENMMHYDIEVIQENDDFDIS